MTIRKPVINTFNRVGIDYESLQDSDDKVETFNRFSGQSVITTPLVAKCISWIYNTSNDYERGIRDVNLSDFDRVKYWVLEVDQEAYMTCID